MPERWKEIEAVLDAVLACPSGERPETLHRLTGDDAELRREVESLLAAHAAADGFLDDSAEAFAGPYLLHAAAGEAGDRPGAVVGRYRLVAELGRGGMGTVWLAERSDGEFEHRVALKLIKRGMDSDEILARFLRERQILARLEHPNIARLLDGGVNDDGRPYFVMEQVAGRAITRYCDEGRLTIEARLRLFMVVCRAVSYAHRNLVVHRDIKPSNVLVDERGELKLLDFGIARLLGNDGETVSGPTAGTGRLMTPEYASPEQLAGRRVTTASDVYQLGILLYELLTGQRPRQEGSGQSETTRRPSAVVRQAVTVTHRSGSMETIRPAAVAASRGTSPERLRRQLRGDLDTIALRALREEPDRRYPSPEDLAEDVERHLANLPIHFGGDRASYRAAKFVRRHRLSVAAVGGGVLLTLGLLGFDAVRVRQERDRARHEADKAIEVSQLMARFLQGWNPDASDRGEVSAKKLLGEAAIRAERELSPRPEMLAATLSILGDFHTTLGDWNKADSLLRRAIDLQQRLGDQPNADLAATLVREGRLYRVSGRSPEAIAVLRRSLALHRTLFGPRHAETLRVARELAAALRDAKRYKDAETELRAILEALDPGRGARNSSPFALEVASDLGYAVYQQGFFDEAVEILRPTLEGQRALFGDVHLATVSTLRGLGSALRDRGDLDQAEPLYREVLRVTRALYGEQHQETMGALLVLALVLERKNELAEAEQLARESLEVSTQVYGADHPITLGHVGHVGVLRLDRGDRPEAERLLRQVYVKLRPVVPPGDPDWGDVLNRLAYLLVRRRAPDAEVIYREAVRFDDARPADQPDFVSDGIHFLAWAEQHRGDSAQAVHDYNRALRIYQQQLPATHPYRTETRKGLDELTRPGTKG